jgi:hypothetical protein
VQAVGSRRRLLKISGGHKKLGGTKIAKALQFVCLFGIGMTDAPKPSATNAVRKKRMANFMSYRERNATMRTVGVKQDYSFGLSREKYRITLLGTLTFNVHLFDCDAPKGREHSQPLDGILRSLFK